MEIRVMGLPLLLTTALFCSGLFAALVAKAKGMKVVSMTGPIYHALCAAIEEVLF